MNDIHIDFNVEHESKSENIIEITKKRIMDAFSKIKGKKILLLDDRTFTIVNSICDIRNMTNIGISLVELLESNRTKMKDMDAIYFIEPTEYSVKHIVRDFNIPGSAYYKQAHIFLLYDNDDVLDILSKYSNVVSFIKTFRIAHLNYIPVEQRLFLLDDQNWFYNLYSADSNKLEDSCNLIVQQLYSICASFNYPLIRYARSHPLSAAITAKLCGLIESKEIEMKNSKSVLLLVDRTNDLISPLIHEFSYQAMLADIIGLGENGKLVFKKSSGLDEGKEIVLNEKDKIWVKTRHWHIESVHQKIAESAKHLHLEQAASALKKEELERKNDIKGLFELAKSVPLNHSLASKLSDHLDLISLCYTHFKENNIEELSSLEQDLATGLRANFKKVEYNKVFKALKKIINNPKISLNNKLRLLMINLTTGPIKESWKTLLTNIPESGIDILRNYRDLLKTTSRQKQTRAPRNDEFHYTLQRFKPALYDILKDLINDNLSQEEFPFFDHSEKDKLCDRIKSEKSRWKRSESKNKWVSLLKRSKTDQYVDTSARRIIIFVIGGLSLNELRVCYELSNENVSIFAGSTHLLTPEKFIKDVQKIKPAQ